MGKKLRPLFYSNPNRNVIPNEIEFLNIIKGKISENQRRKMRKWNKSNNQIYKIAKINDNCLK